jgi:hypothetical protein
MSCESLVSEKHASIVEKKEEFFSSSESIPEMILER